MNGATFSQNINKLSSIKTSENQKFLYYVVEKQNITDIISLGDE
jgi:arginine repressor